MAIYRNISLSFWTDTKVEDSFTPEDKYMFLYLLTNPYTNLCGCYEISAKQISRQTGYNEDSVNRILNRLERVHDVIRYNNETKEILILNWGKYNWTKSDKLVKPIKGAIDKIKHTPFREYLTGAFECFSNLSIPYPYPIDTVSIPYPYPTDTTDTDTVTDSIDSLPSDITNITNTTSNTSNRAFDDFWQLYPKKVGKAAALKKWQTIKPDKALIVQIMDAVREQMTTAQWTKEGGQYIPNPATWLNQGRWDDDIEIKIEKTTATPAGKPVRAQQYAQRTYAETELSGVGNVMSMADVMRELKEIQGAKK